MGAAEEKQGSDRRGEEQADEAEGDLFGQMPLGAATEHGEVAAHRGGQEPAGPGPGEGVCRGPAQPGGEPAVALRCEDGCWLGQSAQLGQSLGEGRAGRVQAADDQPQAGAEPGAADESERSSEDPRGAVRAT